MKRIDVIGMGPGNEDLLPAANRLRMQTAQRVFNTRQIPISTLLGHLGEPFEGHTVVLVSGDTGFHSLAQTIEKRFGQSHEVVFHPGVGSISVLSAKLKIPYDDAELISLHGNHTLLVPRVSYCHKVFALTGGTQTAADCCRALTAAGLGDVRVAIGEALTLPEERILIGKARDFVAEQGVDLAVLYVENPNWVSPHHTLKDTEFIRGQIPMTKEEIRRLSIGKLEINPEDIVYDVGAGTGSVSVELARKAFRGMVYAIEKKSEGLHLIEANRFKHRAFNLEVVEGTAPTALKGLPTPTKVFIGGSGGQMREIVDQLLRMNPSLRLVVNAVSLQGVAETLKVMEEFPYQNHEVVCINVARARKLGDYDLMMAQNPVYIITMDFEGPKGARLHG